MFRRILLGSALALMACSSKNEDPPSELDDSPSAASSSAPSAMQTVVLPQMGTATSSAASSASVPPQTQSSQPQAPNDDAAGGAGGSGDTSPGASAESAGGAAGGADISSLPSGSQAGADSTSPMTSGSSSGDDPALASATEVDAGGAPAPTAGSCSRDALSAFVDTYLDALAAHDASSLPVTDNVKYTENSHEFSLSEGLWAVAGEAELVRSLIDTVQCSTVTEVVLPEDGTDVVLTLRLTLVDGKLSEAETVITRDGDWLFDAQGYIDSADQKWDVLPQDQRTSREALIAAAKAYYDEFNDNPSEMGDDPIDIPFDPTDCERLEGGAATAGCTMGIPDGVPINNRRYWADEEAGVSVAIALFADLLDVHFYRMISDTIHNVHSMSVQSESFSTTGWPEGED